jgi:hypothetical protein
MTASRSDRKNLWSSQQAAQTPLRGEEMILFFLQALKFEPRDGAKAVEA